jgi:hypothetical protein
MTRIRSLGFAVAVGAALVGGVAGRASADEAVKLDVQSGSKTTTAGDTITSEVTLKNAAGAPAPAARAVDVNVELVGPSGKKQSQKVHFDPGETRAAVRWQVDDPGISHLRAFDAQKSLLDDSDAVYVKPKAAPPAAVPAAVPDASAAGSPSRKKPVKKKPARAPRAHHPKAGAPGAERDEVRGRLAVRLASTVSPLLYLVAQAGSDPGKTAEVDAGLLLDVSARESLGLIANGSDAATVSIFYTGAGPAPTDIHVWLHWECGDLSGAGQPVIPKGGDHAEVRWTSRGPCEGTLQLIGSSPRLPVVGSSRESKVRFVRDVDLQVSPLATFSPLDQPRIVANLVDRSSGQVIAAEVVRTVTFASNSPTLDVAPGTVPINVGATQAVSVLTPRAFFARADIELATPGVAPKPLPVKLSSLGLLLGTSLFALLGSLIRFLQQRRAPLETFVVGLGAAVALVAVYLLGVVRNFDSAIAHSSLAVPIVALAAGYLGQSALDSALRLAGLRSPPAGSAGGQTGPSPGASAAR